MKIKRQLFCVSFLAMAMMALFACSDDGSSEDRGKSEVAYKSCPNLNHPHMIDLGLPSGTKWACCNVGAHSPEAYGGYYAWGETTTKSYYRPGTYQHAYMDVNGRLWDWTSKYSYTYNNIGFDIAGTSYDAATANWGAPWRMPTLAQIQELLNNTTSQWTSQNGVYGRKSTGRNGGTVFLPADTRWYESNGNGPYSYYWSSSLDERDSDYAYCINFTSDEVWWYYSEFHYSGERYSGLPVRPVRKN